MPCSPAQLAANRANARKSTGPVTEEGKARSRENAYKHGMTGAGVVLSDEDAEAIDARLEALLDDLKPQGETARLLVERAALHSVRMDRSARQEAGHLSGRVEAASAEFVEARRGDAEELLRSLAAGPSTNARRLMATPEGVDLLIGEWEKLKRELEDQRGTKWNHSHWLCADRMHGHESWFLGPTEYQAWSEGLNGNYKSLKPEHFGPKMTDDEKRQFCLMKISGLVDADLARVREFRANMDTSARDARLAHAAAVALFDPSKEAILARKYEAASERAFMRILVELKEMRKEARIAQATQAARPRAQSGSFSQPAPAKPRNPARGDFEAIPAPILPSNEVPISVGRSRKRRN